VATLLALIEARSPVVRREAMNCLVHFDFSNVREALTRKLETIDDLELFQTGLCLFEANPDPANPYALFRLERIRTGEFSRLVGETAGRCRATLERLGWLGASERDMGLFEARWQDERARRQAPAPGYSVRNLYPSPPAWRDFLGRFWNGLGEAWREQVWGGSTAGPGRGGTTAGTGWGRLGAFLAGCLVIGGWLLTRGGPATPVEGPGTRPPLLAASPLLIEGTIDSLVESSGQFTVRGADGKRFLLPLADLRTERLRPWIGRRLRATVYPSVLRGDGVTEARVDRAESPDPDGEQEGVTR